MDRISIVLDAIDKAKGVDTIVYNVSSHNPFVEYVFITSASNSRQIQALAQYVREAMIIHDLGYSHIEGNDSSKWILVDSSDIVVHIFEENERDIYALEKLYMNCERVV